MSATPIRKTTRALRDVKSINNIVAIESEPYNANIGARNLCPAQDFVTWGLVNKVVPDADLRAEAVSLARGYARHRRRVLTAIKCLTRGAAAPVARLARSELEALADYVNYPDLANGLARFAARK